MFLPAKVPTVSVNNPLLQSYDLPPFSAIRAEHVQPAIEQILADNRAAIIEILKTQVQTRPGPAWCWRWTNSTTAWAPPGARSAT
jgi:oligopeptidase A